MRKTRVFGRLIAALTVTPSGAGWTHGSVVKWGAEREVRETLGDAAITCCVRLWLDVESLMVARPSRSGSHFVVIVYVSRLESILLYCRRAASFLLIFHSDYLKTEHCLLS